MAGVTSVHHSSYFIFQDWDIRRRFHCGRPHLTDDPSIISLVPSVGMIALRRITVEHCSIQFNVPDGIHH